MNMMLSSTFGVQLILWLFGLWILRSILRQLGGEPMLVTDIANKIAVGDLSSDITLSTDDTSSVMNAMKRMSVSIQAVIADTHFLVKTAEQGQLDVRADTTKHQGDFYKLVTGINQTLDGIIDPVNEVVAVLTDMEVLLSG